MLAAASNAIIVGFNVRPDSVAESIAERDGVDMRMYRIIYDCIEEISDAIKGMLAPKYREVTLGKAEVRNVFKLSSAGMIAGSYVLDGKITRNSQIRVVRDGIVVSEDSIASLKRFKDDVKEVQSGYECGIGLEKFKTLKRETSSRHSLWRNTRTDSFYMKGIKLWQDTERTESRRILSAK